MKVFVITKKTIIRIAAAAAFLIAAIVLALVLKDGKNSDPQGNTSAANDRVKAASSVKTDAGVLLSSDGMYEAEVLAGFNRELPVYSVARTDKKIALTIDAAWDDDKTPFILETLDRYGIKATFFLCGQWVKAYPDKVKLIHEAGHSIGNHSMTHPHMTKIDEAQIVKELTELNDLIEKITGERPTLFRAPFGEYNDKVIQTVRNAGYEPIQWDVDTIDWKPERSSQTILDTVLPKLKDGSIILCHNNGFKIEEYLPTLIETAQAQGFSFVTVDELLLKGDTVIDVNGVQKTA